MVFNHSPPAVATVVGKAASWTDPNRLPTVTHGMGSPRKIYFDSETIDIIPLPPAHTDGDTMVRFEKADIVMVGDFYRTYGYSERKANGQRCEPSSHL